MSRPVWWELIGGDADSAARAGVLHTPSGDVETPAFMPVGTQATVKGLVPDLVAATGAQMLLANTYHLALRPGEDVIAELGGLHAVMSWNGPILTDSGGFQVVSLADRVKIDDRRSFCSKAARARSSVSNRQACECSFFASNCGSGPKAQNR